MNQTLKEKDYKNVFHFFSEISKIPRGSKNNTAISNYLVDFAKTRGLEYFQDEYENVVIIKEATKGYEEAPAIILQGHMDMVCEKIKESTHDFLNDGIELLVDGDYLRGNNTTLGGDNGIALAYALAFLDDKELEHPRLEAVFTTDEEVGMEGAIGLDVSSLQGKYLINMDSEDEGTLLSSSAGGLTGTCELPITRIKENGLKIQIGINDLKGGHSGAEIHRNRTNGIKLLSRLLFDLRVSVDYNLISMEGGQKDNVIPRDSYAIICIEPESLDVFNKTIEVLSERYKKELAISEPDLNISTKIFEESEFQCLHPTSFEKVLLYLINTPNGVQKMSAVIEGLVESSLNIGVLRIEEEKAIFRFSVRSSINSYKQFISDRLEYLAEFLGGEYYIRGQYPAWEYKVESPLREHMINVFRDVYGKEPEVEAIHAGLESSFFAEKISNVDIVALGPDMQGIHTPKERLNIPSAIRVYKYLEKVIEGIKE
jgi:dipeptidase D